VGVLIRFQYPKHGSIGCSGTQRRHVSPGQDVFQYPKHGSIGCSLPIYVRWAEYQSNF